MDELSDYTSPVVEFKAVHATERNLKLVDSSTSTDPKPAQIDAAVETIEKCSKQTQTETFLTIAKNVDEKKLANWLQKIYAVVEKELLKGCTPALDLCPNELKLSDIKIQPYQKLSVPALANSHGLAVWLSVFTNNAPVLVLTTVAPHDDWCEHMDQYLKLFVPQRVSNGSFVTFNEQKSISIKSCLKSLSTNQFNKNIFAGSTYDGDIYVWQYQQLHQKETKSRSDIGITEIFHVTPSYGYALSLDWCSEFTLLTAHSNGHVVQWNLGKEITMETEYLINSPDDQVEICTILALGANNFAVGTNDGSVLHCMISSLSAGKRRIEIVPLKKHLFMISTLLRTNINGHKILVSCDLSGEVYFHYLRNSNDNFHQACTSDVKRREKSLFVGIAAFNIARSIVRLNNSTLSYSQIMAFDRDCL